MSLLLAPLAAECGLKVPMLSGRGLGHTGGTLDKLEAIPGYNIHMTNDEFLGLVDRVGCAIIGQSGSIAPADGRIYALRDVTATVDCVPLITASIMSKKLAAGPRTIVIDLKTGSGAFMDDLERARELASNLVAIGRLYGRSMSVVFSDMDQPLGVAIGHANETIEALAALRPRWSRQRAPGPGRLDRGSGRRDGPASRECAPTGRRRWISCARCGIPAAPWNGPESGSRPRADAWDPGRDDFGLKTAPLACELVADREGWLAQIQCREVGLSLADMHGARRRVEDPLDLGCGVDFLPSIGDRIERGDVLARALLRPDRRSRGGPLAHRGRADDHRTGRTGAPPDPRPDRVAGRPSRGHVRADSASGPDAPPRRLEFVVVAVEGLESLVHALEVVQLASVDITDVLRIVAGQEDLHRRRIANRWSPACPT